MADSARPWLKYGCFGCLALVALLVLIVVVFAGVAWISVGSSTPEERTFTPQIPTGSLAGEAAETLVQPPAATVTSPGTVILDLRHGEFNVEPAPPGEPLRIEANFDPEQYELSEKLESSESGGWVYEVGFRSKQSSVLSMLNGIFGKSPRVLVQLPTDVPLDLDMTLREGGAEIELGGLWLVDASFTLDKGGAAMLVSQPLREPMGRLDIEGSMGGLAALKLGNASPREMNVRFGMGGLDLDLRGAWRQDCTIDIDTNRAGGSLRLPRDVIIEGVASRGVDFQDEAEIPRPTLTFSISATDGEFDIR